MDFYTLFNHLFLSVNALTYQEIVTSDFLRNEFAVSETRTTVRVDYPDGYSGLYFYGDETYFEFFDAENSAFSLASFGIASGFEKKGQVEKVKKQIDATSSPYSYVVDRAVDDKKIDWFTALISNTKKGHGNASVWAMEYKDTFIKSWLGYSSELDGSILQSDVLKSYAIKLRQTKLRQKALMKDIISIDVAMEDQHLQGYADQFVALGWKMTDKGDCKMLTSRNTDVQLCPVSKERGVGIYKIGFSLHREHLGSQKMTFGSSTLTFNGKKAEWDFTYPNQKTK